MAGMQQRQHYMQDALELLAVARLQSMAEEDERSISQDSAEKYADFKHYAQERSLSMSDFRTGKHRNYLASLDKHLPHFYSRVEQHFSGEKFDFVSVEVEYRNLGRKGDFEIRPERSQHVSVSLKNYLKSAMSPQFNTQTFNTFALGFFFERLGVGKYVDPTTGDAFTSSNRAERDRILKRSGFSSAVKHFHDLDDLQASIRNTFVDTPEWEFYDEAKMDPIRKQVGLDGAEVTEALISNIPATWVKQRLLKMAGMDGNEELLIMDPRVMAESVTEFSKLKRLYSDVRADHCTVDASRRGQSIILQLVVDGEPLIVVRHPHTLNLNGAWILDDAFHGGRYHEKEGMVLQYGQRRPMKSKQISVFVLTYLDLGRAGIFDVS